MLFFLLCAGGASSLSLMIKKQTIKAVLPSLYQPGYQSALSLEILASVDIIKRDNPGISKEEAKVKFKDWSERKRQLFKDKYLDIAWNHLDKHAQDFGLNF